MSIVCAVQMRSSEQVIDNLKEADLLLAKACQKKARLVILPEMFAVMGMDKINKLTVKEAYNDGPIQTFLANSAKNYGMWIVGGTIPIATEDPNKIHAACLVYNDEGCVVARYNKIHLFDVCVVKGKEEHKESDTTLAGDTICVVDTPVGRLGLAVCYDLRFPELFRILFNKGAEIFSLPSAFTNITGRAHWEVLTRARAIENLSYVVAACQGGIHHSGRKTYGHSLIINPWGKVLQSLEYEPGIITSDIDLDYLHELRSQMPVMEHQTFFVNANRRILGEI